MNNTLILLGILSGLTLGRVAPACELVNSLSSPFSESPQTVENLQSKAKVGKAKFLVASPHLRDPNFFKTVVLMIRHDQYGALGLVINRPSDVRISEVFPENEEVKERNDTLFIGGPVAVNRFMFLLRADSQPTDSHRVFEDIFVSSSEEAFRQMIQQKRKELRIYAGHAGWAPGQLDAEISRGDWQVLPPDREFIFNKEPSEIWPELIRRCLGQWVKVIISLEIEAFSFHERLSRLLENPR